jgi:hypothetical protein
MGDRRAEKSKCPIGGPMRIRIHTASLLALAACSGSSSGTGSTTTGTVDSGGGTGTGSVDSGGTGTPRADAGGNGGGDSGPSVSDAGSGSGSVDGSVGGTPFGGAAASLWIGSPDDPATTVVYLFSKPVACGDLATPGWDTRIPNGTQMLEMKMFGTSPATYKVVTTQTPAPGEAAVNYTLSTTSGTPTEQVGSGGTITLTKTTASVRATGSFALNFATSNIAGTFDAAFCAGGHEP